MPDCSAAHEVPPSLEVGTGSELDERFEPLPPGGELPLFAGPQHGYHVYLQVEARGFCPERVVFAVEIRDGEETLRGQEDQVVLEPGRDGALVFPRAQVTFVCPPPLLASGPMQGRPLDFRIRLTESPCGATAEAPRSAVVEAAITPTCPEGDQTCLLSTTAGCAVP